MRHSTVRKDAKVVLVGDHEVGKSCLVGRMLCELSWNDVCAKASQHGSDNVTQWTVHSDEKGATKHSVTLHDLSGDHKFADKFRSEKRYEGADVVVICYNTAYKETLLNIEKKWMPEIKAGVGAAKKPAILLVGTQVDIRDDASLWLELAVDPVTKEAAEEVAKKIGAHDVVETSAKEDRMADRIGAVLLCLLAEILDNP